MIILGLTGSIGMGKSTSAGFFREAGIPVHDADATVHALYSGRAVPVIAEHFPEAVTAGKVDRERLRQMVIGEPAKLALLEQLIHPLVRQEEQAFIEQAKAAGQPLVVLDIPLLYETGGNLRCDKVAVVSAPAEIQRQRVLARRQMSEAEFAAVLAKQMPDSEKRRRADFIIDSSRSLDEARQQVRDIIIALTGRT